MAKIDTPAAGAGAHDAPRLARLRPQAPPPQSRWPTRCWRCPGGDTHRRAVADSVAAYRRALDEQGCDAKQSKDVDAALWHGGWGKGGLYEGPGTKRKEGETTEAAKPIPTSIR
eukprot:scaffold61376_cov17-Tisochrysis_lutea.AAC.1